MNLTWRGRLVGSAIVAAFVWGFIFRIPALNAIVLPGIVAMASAWVLVGRAGDPTVERSAVEPAEPGERRVASILVDHDDTLTGDVVDATPEHVHPANGTGRHPVVEGHATYELVSERRGIGRLGPVTVRMRDPLGLVERTSVVEATTEIVTYPAREPFAWSEDVLVGGAPASERHAFDRLREYDPGDSLRDIHWRSSAKRPDHEFTVKEFVAEADAEAVVVAGTSTDGRDDELATALASVTEWLLDAGIAVGLELSDVRVPVGAGSGQRRRIRRALARTGGGTLDPDVTRSATVTVRADDDAVRIDTYGTSVTFEDVSGSSTPIATDGGRRS